MSDKSPPVYDETGSKLLVTALVAGTERETIVALDGLRRYIGRENLSSHDAKLFFAAGHPGTWMRSLMQTQEYAQKRWLEAEEKARVFQKRLVVVEAALRRIRNILKGVAGSDTKDRILQWDIERAATEMAGVDNDHTDDPTEQVLAKVYAKFPDLE